MLGPQGVADADAGVLDVGVQYGFADPERQPDPDGRREPGDLDAQGIHVA